MKKGFTLVEVLVTITLLSVLAIFLLPNLISFSNNTKKELYNTEITNIKTSAKKYGKDNLDLLTKDGIIIKVSDLIKENYITQDEIINPITNKTMENCEIKLAYDKKIKIEFIKEKNQEYNRICGE